MANEAIEWFWDQMYQKVGTQPKDIPPRILSHFLDQAQRGIVQRLKPTDLPRLNILTGFKAATAGDAYSIDGNAAKIDIGGENGIFHQTAGGDYIRYQDDGTNLKRELRSIEEVAVSIVTNPGEAGPDPPAESIVYHRARKLSVPELGLYLSNDYGGSYYNTQYNEDYRWIHQGSDLLVFSSGWLQATTPTGNTLKILGSFFPERFLNDDGDLKTKWLNDSKECELPSEFWPEMVDLAVQKLMASRSGASGMQLESQTDLLGATKAEEIEMKRGTE